MLTHQAKPVLNVNNRHITFSVQKDVNISEKHSQTSLDSIDTDLVGEDIRLIRVLRKYAEYFIDGIPTHRVSTGVLRINPIDPHKMVQRRPYRLSPVEREIVKEKV